MAESYFSESHSSQTPKKLPRDGSPYVIAIDGPAGSGKSTLAREIARKFGIQYLDSGAFYRALTLALYRRFEAEGGDILFSQWTADREEILDLDSIQVTMEFGGGNQNKMYLNGEDVTSEIRLPAITEKIKYVADKRKYRDFVNQRIRQLAKTTSLAMDGRDIGTEVFPNTPFKFFLTASPEERARRRLAELEQQGIAADFQEVFQDMVKRDQSDESRKIAPLVQAKDAILVDTDGLSIKVVLETILSSISDS